MFGCLDVSICLDVCMLRCLDDRMLRRFLTKKGGGGKAGYGRDSFLGQWGETS